MKINIKREITVILQGGMTGEQFMSLVQSQTNGGQNPFQSITPSTPSPEDVQCYVEIPTVSPSYFLSSLHFFHN